MDFPNNYMIKFHLQSNPKHQIDSTRCDDSSVDVICMSDFSNVNRHRPIKEYDVISGRYIHSYGNV